MSTELAETAARPYRLPLFNLRWSAVAAGLAVGVTSELFLLLLGAALGLGLVERGIRVREMELLVAAGAWNALAMLAASLASGYIAARASGMRRAADGVLHGVLAWSVAMLLLLAFATSGAGATLGEMLSTAAGRPVAAQTLRPLDPDERGALADVLVGELGLTKAQAGGIAARVKIPEPPKARTRLQILAEARRALRAASLLGSWLSGAILASLLGAVAGGMLGCRGARRGARPAENEGEVIPADTP